MLYDTTSLIFLSTLSLRRATLTVLNLPSRRCHFYPRSPCGERQLYINRTTETIVFLSTLSLRRATEQSASYNAYLAISIHALLAESDPISELRVTSNVHFYPRSPCGERHVIAVMTDAQSISIHALLAESDQPPKDSSSSPIVSIHALLAESDTENHTNLQSKIVFLSTLSLRRATPV